MHVLIFKDMKINTTFNVCMLNMKLISSQLL